MKRLVFALAVLLLTAPLALADVLPPPPPPPPQEASDATSALAALAVVVGVILLGAWMSRRPRNTLEPLG
jgi:hypothetical protein